MQIPFRYLLKILIKSREDVMDANKTMKEILDLLNRMERCDCCCYDPCDSHAKLSKSIRQKVEKFVERSLLN